MTKIIGIVGGLGPKAGENLHARILANTRAVHDQDHLPILLYTNPRIPDRSEFIFGETSENPAEQILRSLRLLHDFGARVMCVPCNTAHSPVIWDVVADGFGQFAAGAELLHIINLTVEHIVRCRPSVSHVGILATTGAISAEVYQQALAHRNFRPVLPTETHQRNIQDAIYHPDWGIKAVSSPVTQQATDALEAAAFRMIVDGAEAVIMGCTEIPLALNGNELKGIPLIDSTAVLAREAIRCAAGEARLTTLMR